MRIVPRWRVGLVWLFRAGVVTSSIEMLVTRRQDG
jgi:hypothetical protein